MFLIDTFTIVYVVFFSLRNDKVKEGARQLGLFRLREEVPAAAGRAAPGRVTPGRRAGPGRVP